MSNLLSFISARARLDADRSGPPGLLAEAVGAWLNRLRAGALLVLLMLALLIVAALVWRADGAPILFAHYRVGRNGRLFQCVKFRFMRKDADVALAALLRSDPHAAQ